jgi:leader peptidase (prepilin peptidase)/N-methyltransferase
VCPDCEHVLAPKDLVPVLSWLSLGGKCRYCRAPIKDHPAVEVATALVFAVSAYALAASGRPDLVIAGFWAVMLVMLIVLAVSDMRWMVLPDKVTMPLLVVSFAYTLTIAILQHAPIVLVDHLAGAAVAGGFFFAIAFFSKGKAMGGGDIKLAFVLGLMLGLENTAVAVMVACWGGSIYGLTMMGIKGRAKGKVIPFGPWLVLGTIVAFLYGKQIVDLYLKLANVT